MKKIFIKIINKILHKFKAQIISTKYMDNNDFRNVYVPDYPENKIIDIYKLSGLSNNIQGMISNRAGEELFSLAYMQALDGDIVEVGSFQGKSTFFLASAVKYSGNGKMIAIDHFQGNLGKEKFYRVNNDPAFNLEDGFVNNIKKANLDKTVTLINQSNEQAVKFIEDKSIRFLFIDSDHTAEGVYKDLNLFRNKLKRKAIIAFDDYSQKTFPGVVEVSNEFIKSMDISKKYLMGRTLIIELKG